MDLDLVSFTTDASMWRSRPPEGFPHRFAVITVLSLDGDHLDPWRLLRLAAPELVRLTTADAVTAEFWYQRRRWLRSPRRVKTGETPLLPYLDRDERVLHEQEEDFPSEVRFERDGRVVLRMETEYWMAIGGPAPYHDSVTLSFHSPSDVGGDLEQLFRRAAADAGYEVVAARPAEDGPWSRYGRWWRGLTAEA